MRDPYGLDREVEIRNFAHRKRSNLMRSADRAIRAGIAAAKGRSRPRNDAQIMRAWLERVISRAPNVFAVDEPEWRYEPDPRGPGATQIAFVRAVEVRDDERGFFTSGMRVAPGTHFLRIPVLRAVTAVWAEDPR